MEPMRISDPEFMRVAKITPKEVTEFCELMAPFIRFIDKLDNQEKLEALRKAA